MPRYRAPALTFLFLTLVILVGCLVSLRSIRAFPNFSATDEAIIFDYTDTWKRTGVVEPSLMPYSSPIVNGNLYLYAAALWTNWFPNDPLALRNFSALGGFVLLVVAYAVTRQLADRLTALTASALMAANLLWLAVGHIGRQDVWLAVCVWTAVGLALAARKRGSRKLAFIAGLTAALSADVHPLGVLACLALGIWWLFAVKRAITTWRMVLAFVLGGLLGTAYYLVAHVLPDPTAFVQAIHNELYSYGAEGGTPLSAMILRHLNYLASNPLEIGLLLLCSIHALRRSQTQGVGVFLTALFLLYLLLVADPNPYYPIVWFTGLVILSAVTLRQVNTRQRAPLMLAFVVAFAINVARVERHVDANWNARALDAIQQVAARVPQDRRGLGETFLYIALRGHPILHESGYIGFTYIYFRALDTGSNYRDVIEPLQPGWIVTMVDESAFTPPFDTLSIAVPHMHLAIPDELLQAEYALTDSIPTSVGTFEIWRRR